MEVPFESIAEETAYPFIAKISNILNLKLYLQYKIMEYAYFDWVEKKIENNEWDENDAENYEYQNAKPVGYNYEKFRIDFAFPQIRKGIEIDGEKYHDYYNDQLRDDYLRKHGNWKIIRISARDVFNGRIKEILDEEFGIGQRTLLKNY